MKNMLLAAIFSAFSILAIAKGGEVKTVTIKTQIYCSHCMQCGSCGPNINDRIREGKGIKKVSVDSKANTITVTYDADKTNVDAIRAAINKAGFDADDKKAPAEAVNSLDGCCKKH